MNQQMLAVIARLKEQLRAGDGAFWPELARATSSTQEFDVRMQLLTLMRRACVTGVTATAPRATLRLAMVGGYTLQPLASLVELSLCSAGFEPCVFTGEYANHVAEILQSDSELYKFAPQVVFILPPEQRCTFAGGFGTTLEEQRRAVERHRDELLELCRVAHERSQPEVLLANYLLPERFDPGAARVRTLAADYSFRKAVNLELGLAAPSYVHICDLEFLGARRGGLASRDDRLWFESKQIGSPALLVDIADEIAQLARGLRHSPKKVLVCDLDQTLWGGVVGDDGIEGVELGDTSPRGEAFKAFQAYLASLKDRGVLLAAVTKNEPEVATAMVEGHPEMVLRMRDFVAFKAGWGPKSDSLKEIASELRLGLDSFVFIDDNPAEIEIVRQFAPEVSGILLGPDPSEFRAVLADSRLFEPRAITAEDSVRTRQYQEEAARNALSGSATDMDSYLRSLEMEATIAALGEKDVPRAAQLINKSNQFNLTTIRRTEAEVSAMIGSTSHLCLTVRLRDRFGDYGLICAVVLALAAETIEIDTWLMSCRVLNRQVEQETLNEIVRIAVARGARTVTGRYVATPKNKMVRDLYPRLGFVLRAEQENYSVYSLSTADYHFKPTWIRVKEGASP
jgi:FkbH-like protein